MLCSSEVVLAGQHPPSPLPTGLTCSRFSFQQIESLTKWKTMAAAKKSGYNIFTKIILIPLSYQLLIFALAMCFLF